MVTIYFDHPVVNRIALLLWDILVFMAAITVSSSCTAGTGSLLNTVFGLPYFAGCAIFIIGMVLVLSFGKNILDRIGKMGIPLIVVFFLICFVAIFSNSGHLTDVMATSEPVTEISTGAFLRQCMVYAITQCSFFQALAVMAGRFESRADSIKFTVTGFLMNCGAMIASYFALMAYYPECGESTIPMYTIASQFGGALGIILTIAYYFVLLMAYITTAGGAIAGGQARYTPLLSKKISNESICHIIVAVVFLLGASLLSTLGLDGILTTVNSINSACRLPVWFLPFFILGPISIHKLSKKLKSDLKT